MSPASIGYLQCPACAGEIAPAPRALCCIQCRRAFPLDNGIPVFLDHDAAEVRANIAALDAETARYPLVLTAIALLARVWLPAERRRLIGRIELCPGGMVLDHCTGPGGNLPALASAVGPSGKLVAMDLSRAMVHKAQQRRMSSDALTRVAMVPLSMPRVVFSLLSVHRLIPPCRTQRQHALRRST